jgi:hypothetical protein
VANGRHIGILQDFELLQLIKRNCLELEAEVLSKAQT